MQNIDSSGNVELLGYKNIYGNNHCDKNEISIKIMLLNLLCSIVLEMALIIPLSSLYAALTHFAKHTYS